MGTCSKILFRTHCMITIFTRMATVSYALILGLCFLVVGTTLAAQVRTTSNIAQSSIVFDFMPVNDQTNMTELERLVRGVQADGVVWENSKLLPMGDGMNKLRIAATITDNIVDYTYLQQEITKFPDFVQSVQIVSWHRL